MAFRRIAPAASPSALTTLLALLSLLAIPGAALAQVQSVTVSKGYSYLQTSATTVFLDPASNNYSFNADVDGQNIAGIAPPTLSGPINTAGLGAFANNGQLVYRAGDSGWRYGINANDYGTSSLAILDSFFGSGTYVFTVNGNLVPLVLAGNAYPNPAVMTLTGGNWANGAYVLDPAQPLTITTNAFTAYGTHADDLICVGAIGPGFPMPFVEVAPFGCGWLQARQFHSSVPGSNTLSFTFPPNTFVAGQEYVIGGGFQALVDVHPVAGLPGSTNAAYYRTTTTIRLLATAPVFPMTVTSNIGPVTSTVSAQIQYRPQDVGTSGSVFVFASAPSDVVKASPDKEAPLQLGHPKRADGSKDTSVVCVLAQLSGSGQLQAVSAAALQAYVSGVLSGQGQAVSIVNGVSTANIAGATFFVGYGSNAAAMLSGGLNRSAVTVPGPRVCKPQAPQAGWWWNPAEGGRGFSVEVRGNNLFYAGFLYDESGRSTWHVAAGPVSLDGSLFTGDLLKFTGGQTLTGAYKAPGPQQVVGPITLAFSDDLNGTMAWPGGTVGLERFNIVAGGVAAPPKANVPESGWWWNANESGRGYFIEWQDGTAFIAGYMYDDAGNPVWYLTSGATTDPLRYTGTWGSFANGQTLTGPYRPATQVNANVGPVTIQFTSATTANLTLPGGRTVALTRFRF